MVKKLVKYLTRWAWDKELQIIDGSAELKALCLEPNKLEMEIKLRPELKEYIALCLAEIVRESPNYTEMKFNTVAKTEDGVEWITVLVKKGSGKTPHELRVQAEKERDEARDELVRIQSLTPA